MKINSVAALVVFAFASSVNAQNDPNEADRLVWQIQKLHHDNNEGIAVGDINGDGKLDIAAGEFWYRAPDYKQQPLRKIESFGDDYLQNNSDHLFDVDSDGDLDVISGGFTLPFVNWFENPGADKHKSGTWKKHRLTATGTKQNEVTFLHDIDSDGKPEFIQNSWNNQSPMQLFRLTRGKENKLEIRTHDVSKSGNGHGMGFGDINGDGKQDIVFQRGWYQQPTDGAFSGSWRLHDEFDLPHASCPLIVTDLNSDGENDIIWANGHGYGLYWLEQVRQASSDDASAWRQHLIDKSFSQGHCLAWEDIDNDGKPELITGKRYFAHSGKDPGAKDEITMQYYNWDARNRSWSKHLISSAAAGKGPGTGLQIRIHDLDDDGWKDVVVAGKSGTHILWNKGYTNERNTDQR